MEKKPSTDRKAAWTVLVYLAGDNNLTEEMAWSLQELKITAEALRKLTPAGEPPINVVAHFDPRGARSRRYDFLPAAPPAPPQLPAIEDGNLDHYEAIVYTPTLIEGLTKKAGRGLAALPGQPSSPTNRLTAFVREQVQRLYPAHEYFLVLSGHGSGAVGDFLTDSDPDTSLSIPELAQILDKGRDFNFKTRGEHEEGQPTVPKRIGILGMDSCLMSNAEVCFEIRDHANLLVASEGWVSNTGWPYHRVLEALFKGTAISTSPKDVAQQVGTNYANFYRDYEISGVSTDVAACDLEAFRRDDPDSLLARLQAFARECIPRLEAVYVRAIVARTDDAQIDAARATLANLSQAVAKALCPQDSDAAGQLAKRLENGSTHAKEALRGKALDGRMSWSQIEALRELLDSLCGHYDLRHDTVGARLAKHRSRLLQSLDKPTSLDSALAVVRALREFDPAMQEALELIEKREDSLPTEATRGVRARLQKIHQVQSRLALFDLASEVPSDERSDERYLKDRRLRDALVAARWQAQSFKAGVYVDLFDLCQCLGERLTTEVGEKAYCDNIQDAIAEPGGAVVLSHHTGPAFQHAHGLSVYFPVEAQDYGSEYENLEFAEQTGWGRLVRSYLRLTRRDRRDESKHWFKADDSILRFGAPETDPLETDTIESRIIGVVGPPSSNDRVLANEVRAGTEKRIRAGTEKNIRAATAGVDESHRAGTEKNIRAGTEKNIREGTERKIKGEGILAVWGNPPDGFFRATTD